MTADIIAGPAIILWGGQSIYTQGDIVVRKVVSSWNPNVATFGTLGRRLTSIHYEISLTPCGILSAAQLAVLFPYTAASVGTSIYTAANVPLVIWSADGKKYTFTRAGLSKPPSVRLSANSTAFGDMQFMAVLGLSKAHTDADAFLAITSVAFTDATFATANFVSPGYNGSWKTYTTIDTEDGFQVDVGMGLQPHGTDRLGIFSHRITGFEVSVKFKPVSLSEADFYALSENGGTGVQIPGQPFGGDSDDITIAGTGVQLVVPAVGPAEQTTNFGNGARAGEVVMHSMQEFAVGVPNALMTWTIT